MRKCIVLLLLMVISNSASASLCSYSESDCMAGKTKYDSEKSMYSNKHFDDSIWKILTKVEDLLTKIDNHEKNDSSPWGDDNYDKLSYGMKHGKSEKYKKGGKHDKGNNWLAFKHDQDDFDGSWMYGYGQKRDHGFKGHHGNKGHHGFKKWWKHNSHKPHHDYETPAVPVPAAAWLFGSGLIGLVAVARRKKFC